MDRAHHSRVSRLAASLAAAALLAPAGVALAGVEAHATGQSTTIASRGTPKLGKILVDSRGRTLYLFAHDAKNRSNCTGQCAQRWTPLVANGQLIAKARSGVNQKLIGKTHRSDGKTQVTYNGHPLYLYTQDKKAGDLHGEGAKEFSGRWYVVNMQGKQVTPKKKVGSVCNPLCPGY